ncbi:PilZ domain-containing protein [Desulfococcaceae bacterium HSG8]|nr:PilZ domain-containing protein [Desulfococcaceae bacterium HSG8]
MNLHTRRADTRSYYEAPIVYANYYDKSYREATMYNISAGGMYFESENELRPGPPIYIKMINFPPDTCAPGAYRTYLSEIRWCRKASVFGYGIGVRHISTGYIVKGEGICETYGSCDLCGGETPLSEMHVTGDSMNLCFECFKLMGAGVYGDLSENTMNFMVGNVI